jgi:ribonuclease HI
LIHSLSRSTKVTWGIKHEALKKIYKGAILPLLLYGAPVWIDAMKFEHNKRKYIRVQRLINIRTAKAFRTTLSEAICILTGITPIIIKTEEAVKQYNVRKGKGSQTQELDTVVDLKDWPHPADCVTITEAKDYKEPTVQAYTDGNKCEQGVGSGAAIFIGKETVAQFRLKLDSRCSNNQAEQLAIIKALEAIESIDTTENSPRTTIFTDRITLDSLQNSNKHKYLIEEIRKRVATLQGSKWKVEFSWVKAHVGICGNEIADRLAKEEARSKDTDIAFGRIPISTLRYELEEESRQGWQKEWENCTKAAITKQYFPTLQERLNMKIRVTQNIAAMVTGHGNTRAYLHRLKLLENATCACKQGDQTVDHLIYQCTLMDTQRGILKKNVINTGHWPASKQELITKHGDSFITFIEAIDFGKL